MPYPIDLYLSAPRQMLVHWVREIQSIRSREPLAPLVTIVPNHALASALESRLASYGTFANIEILTLWDHARRTLPTDAVLPPVGMEHLLAHHLPPDLVPGYSADIPGLYLTLIRAGLECRQQHISEDRLKSENVPWAATLSWLDRIFSDNLFDEFRVYQYAAEHPIDTADIGGHVIIFGYSEAHNSQWHYFKKLAQRHSLLILTPWLKHGENSLAESWVTAWKALGARVTVSEDSRTVSNIRRLMACGPRELAENTFRAIQSDLREKDWRAQDFLIVDSHGQWSSLVARVGKTLGIPVAIDRSRDEPGLERMLWQIFWDVSQGRARRAEVVRWIEYQGLPLDPVILAAGYRSGADWARVMGQVPGFRALMDWAKEWGRRVLQVPRWQDVRDLVQEAVDRHGGLWQDLLEWGHQWEVWDQRSLGPSPRLVERILLYGASHEPDSGSGIPMQSVLNARLIPARGIYVLDVGDGIFPGWSEPQPVWNGGLRRRLGLPAEGHRYRQERQALELLAETGEHVWFIADSSRGEVRWPGFLDRYVVISPTELPVLPNQWFTTEGRSGQWYRSWWQDPGWNDYTGRITMPTDGSMMCLEGSPSSLEEFGACPYRYFLHRILGLQTPDTQEDGNLVSPGIWGKIAHGALERVVAWRMQKKDDGLLDQMIQQAVGEELRRTPLPAGTLPMMAAYVRRSLVAEIIEALYRMDQTLPTPVEVQSERSITWSVQAGAYRWVLQGRVDRIDRVSDQDWTLLDYKTGKLENPNKVRPHNLQLPLYHEAVTGITHGDPERLKGFLVGVSQKNEFEVKQLEGPMEGVYHKSHDILEGIAHRITSGQFYPVPDSREDPCRVCMYRLICPDQVQAIAKEKGKTAPDFTALWTDG